MRRHQLECSGFRFGTFIPRTSRDCAALPTGLGKKMHNYHNAQQKQPNNSQISISSLHAMIVIILLAILNGEGSKKLSILQERRCQLLGSRILKFHTISASK